MIIHKKDRRKRSGGLFVLSRFELRVELENGGDGEGYQYAHDYPNHYVEQQYLPDEILGSRFLHLGTNGYEQKIRENFKKIGKDIE